MNRRARRARAAAAVPALPLARGTTPSREPPAAVVPVSVGTLRDHRLGASGIGARPAPPTDARGARG